jgi:hypothetical protein
MPRGTRHCNFRKFSAGPGKGRDVLKNASGRHPSVDFPEASLSLAGCSVSFVGLCSNRSLPGADPIPRQRFPSVPSLKKEIEKKSAGLESFVPNRPAITIPVQNLQAVGATITENQQMPRKGVAANYVLGHHRQPIEGTAHVARHRAQVDLNCRRKTQHPYLLPDSMAARTARKVSS